MTKPGPSVTSGADTQPGSDSLFPSGFGGGSLVRTGGVGTGEIADGSVAAADLNMSSVATALAARAEFASTFGQLWTSPAASTTLTGTLTPWVITAVDCTAGAGARTLPAANSVAAGVAVCAKKADTSANTLVVSRAGSDLIYGTGSGATSKTLSLAGEAVEFVSNGVDKWTVRSSDTPSAILASTYARRQIQVSDLATPYVFAHRGGSNIFPENTLDAFLGAASLGCPLIESDVSLLADGGLGIMHDSTVDRTTTASGNVSAWTGPAWRRLAIDAGSVFGGGWPNTIQPPTLADKLAAVGGRAVLVPEAKNGASPTLATAMVRDVVRAGLQKSVIIQVPDPTSAAVCTAAGIASMFTGVTGSEYSAAALAAAGVTWVGALDSSITDPTIAALHAVGIKVIAYLLNRQSDVATWMARGGDGWFSDDPLYSQGLYTSYAYRSSALPLLGTWSHGMQDNTALSDRWSWSTSPVGVQTSDGGSSPGTKALLLGQISPIKGLPAADTFTLEFDWTWTVAFNSGRWVGCFIGVNDGRLDGNGTTRTGVNGYRFLYSQAGSLIIYPVANNVVGSALVSTTFSTLTLPQTFTLQVTMTPTQITWKDTTNNHTVTVADATYRGGYVSLAASGSTAVCTRAAVTA